jgi:deferrochelatase/peroxidase EfeB
MLLEPDKSVIQGLVLRGYTHPFSAHLLFAFPATDRPGEATAAFFRQLYPRVQNAEEWGAHKPASFLNIGLTHPGIRQLGVLADQELAAFPSEFVAGPWSAGSQQSLGDCGTELPERATNPGSPATWWGGRFKPDALHCVVHAYALTQPDLDALTVFITAAAKASNVQELFPWADSDARLTQYQLPDDRIHFGYRDGISEPRLNLSDGIAAHATQGDLANFLIGYSLPTSIVQPGPTAPTSPLSASAPAVEPVGTKAASFAANGCYNAFRILYQDVAAFDALLERAEQLLGPTVGPAPTQEWMAAKLVGRWRNGSPLMLSPEAPAEATKDGEGFCYREPGTPSPDDVASTLRCPFAAHTRVANPRDEHLTPLESLPLSLPAPRIARRGMPYGSPLTAATATEDRGLIGLFLCGSLAGQFEKLYGWMNNNNFATSFPAYPTASQDALMGNRCISNGAINTSFALPTAAAPDKLIFDELPQLIVTRGTAYCLLPSLATLRQLAEA